MQVVAERRRRRVARGGSGSFAGGSGGAPPGPLRSCGLKPSPTKSKRRRSGSKGVVAPSNRWWPTVMTVPSGASKAISVKPAAAKSARMAGVASGGRRCRVHMTWAPGRQNEGRAWMVA